jgi:hypothetical protein
MKNKERREKNDFGGIKQPVERGGISMTWYLRILRIR